MHPDAEVRVPAETAYVAVVRMATAGIAARLDFTLDQVEDLRMAVSEACALLLTGAAEGADLCAAYRLSPERIDIAISTASTASAAPDDDNFGWQVLRATAEEVSAALDGGHLTISLALTRDPAAQSA